MMLTTITKYFNATAFMLLSTLTIYAQNKAEATTPTFNISGSVDAYYRANLNADNTAPDGVPNAAPGSSFAQLPGFALGMANIIIGYKGEKSGFVADLVFGPRGTDAIFNSPIYSETGNIINQLYAYWQMNESIKLTLGNFNTFLGYEVISPVANFNYSTSYLFSYGPFSHAGLKADFALSDDFNLMLGVFNRTDVTELNLDGKYSYGAQLGYSGHYLNLLIDNGAFEIDYTGGFDLSDSFFLGLNAAHYNGDGAGSFTGVAIYPQLTSSKTFTISLRGEYFTTTAFFGNTAIGASDINGDTNVFTLTLTGNATIGNLILKPELRLDNASEDTPYFSNSDLLPQKSLSSFVLAAVYSF